MFPSDNRTRATGIAGMQDDHYATLTNTCLPIRVYFTTYFFSLDKMPIKLNTQVFLLGKCVRTTAKTMVVVRKKQKALALLYLALEPLPNAANSSDVPTEFTAEHNKYEVLKGKFRNLNFLPSTKRQLSILLNFFFPLIDIRCFFSSSKLHR